MLLLAVILAGVGGALFLIPLLVMVAWNGGVGEWLGYPDLAWWHTFWVCGLGFAVGWVLNLILSGVVAEGRK